MNIKRIIREEINDFDWIEGPINPWLEYDGIVFDVEPTREDVNMYIEQCLNTREVVNGYTWDEDSREQDIDEIIDNSYLGLTDTYDHNNRVAKNLIYSADALYHADHTILYSTLIGQNI